ncbi:MAG: NTP transferase domain-containing protein [Lacipirellulaceae bacterium]
MPAAAPTSPDAPTAVVLAAGKGTRMKSELPKVLSLAVGRPMVRHVVNALRSAGIERIVIVVGYRAELVEQALGGEPGVSFALQAEQLGTGHAVMQCRDQLTGLTGPVVIVTGDSPLLQPSSVRALLDEFRRDDLACLLGTAHREDPTGLGRIVRDAAGDFAGIVEEKDATPDQRGITEVNMSTYVFAAPKLLSALDALTTNNAQREYYITDCPSILLARGENVRALAALQPCEALSVNTPDDLAVVEAEMTRQGYGA